MRFHRLKVWPEFFSHLESRHKQFEIRKDDRGFQVGDMLLLCEWDPSPADSQGFKRAPEYTGKWNRGHGSLSHEGGTLWARSGLRDHGTGRDEEVGWARFHLRIQNESR